MAARFVVLPCVAALAAIALATSQAGSAPPGAAAPAPGRHQVVIQVSDADPARWNLALNNARNIQADLGMDNVDIEVVAYGPGLSMLRSESAVASRLASAHAQGIGILACENTMRNTDVERGDVHRDVRFVDAGVVHIMKRQREGWSYIRP